MTYRLMDPHNPHELFPMELVIATRDVVRLGVVDYVEPDMLHSLVQIPQCPLSYLATTPENEPIPSYVQHLGVKCVVPPKFESEVYLE